jgi:hypothetical protein
MSVVRDRQIALLANFFNSSLWLQIVEPGSLASQIAAAHLSHDTQSADKRMFTELSSSFGMPFIWGFESIPTFRYMYTCWACRYSQPFHGPQMHVGIESLLPSGVDDRGGAHHSAMLFRAASLRMYNWCLPVCGQTIVKEVPKWVGGEMDGLCLTCPVSARCLERLESLAGKWDYWVFA